MAKILLLNGSKSFSHSKGGLNSFLVQVAADTLVAKQHEVKITKIDSGYDVEDEVEKYLWADLIIYQMPGWWMGLPWIMKKYVDEVFTTGHGKLYANDGRSKDDPSQKYGSGGLLKGKKYMLSITWNTPLEGFMDKDQFFHGLGVDGVFLPFHKANQFLALESLKTFSCYDVMKNPQIDSDVLRYKTHLVENIR